MIMLNIFISSSVLVIILCIIRRLFQGKMNPQLQYALWLLVVIRLLPLQLLPENHLFSIQSSISIFNVVPEVYNIKELPVDETDERNETNQCLVDSGEVANVPAEKVQTNFGEFLPLLLKRVYVLGILCVSAWLLFVNLTFATMLRRNRHRIKVPGCKLPVYIVHNLQTSCLFIIGFRCGIYLSEDVYDNEIQQKYILAHEYSHYQHLDHLWSFVRSLILIFYWYNPFIWLAASCSKLDCEIACDATAIKKLGEQERFLYGKTLMDLAATQLTSKNNVITLATNISGGKNDMKKRILTICNKPKMVLHSIAGCIILTIGAIAITFTSAKAQPEKKNPVTQSSINYKMSQSSSSKETTEDKEKENEKYLKSTSDYSAKNYCADGLFTEHPSFSYDQFKGSLVISKIKVNKSTTLSFTTTSTGDAAKLTLMYKKNGKTRYVDIDPNAQQSIKLSKGTVKVIAYGNVKKGKIDIQFEENKNISFSVTDLLENLFG